MSIQSEITRIQQAKEGIVDAISEKGITVPDDASISEMPEYIGQIPAMEEVKQEITQQIVAHDTSDTAHAAIRELFKSGASASEIKAALTELGENYKDLYTLANTLKTFLESRDTADETINTWREIEDFLNGLTDRETLTGLMEQEHQKLKADFEEEISGLDAKITTAQSSADAAKIQAYDAYSMADSALDVAEGANETANMAASKAASALEKANSAAQSGYLWTGPAYFLTNETNKQRSNSITLIGGNNSVEIGAFFAPCPYDLVQGKIGNTTPQNEVSGCTVNLSLSVYSDEHMRQTFYQLPITIVGYYPYQEEIQVFSETDISNRSSCYEFFLRAAPYSEKPYLENLGGNKALIWGLLCLADVTLKENPGSIVIELHGITIIPTYQ